MINITLATVWQSHRSCEDAEPTAVTVCTTCVASVQGTCCPVAMQQQKQQVLEHASEGLSVHF
jgi:hypothetical protein